MSALNVPKYAVCFHQTMGTNHFFQAVQYTEKLQLHTDYKNHYNLPCIDWQINFLFVSCDNRFGILDYLK